MKDLFEKALKARSHAHAPYSKFFVGAAVRDALGNIFVGCNIENVSYGATICAERVAISSMVASVGHQNITEILVVTDTLSGCAPCGVCRQFLAEFTKHPDTTKIHVANTKQILKTFTLLELLPHAFKLPQVFT